MTAYVGGFVTLVVFSLMFSVGVNLSFEQLQTVWRRRDILNRGLLVNLVLFPVMTLLLLLVFPLPSAMATGFAVVASAPGPPLLVKRAQMAGASMATVGSLMLMLGLVAVVVTPLTLELFDVFFELETDRVGSMRVAEQVATVQLFPICLGLALQRFFPGIANAIKHPVQVVSGILFVIMVVVLAAPAVYVLFRVGLVTIVVAAVMSMGGLALGHVFGPHDQKERAAVAISGIARNIGLAFVIVTANGLQPEVAAVVAAYMVLGFFFGVPYAIWSRGRIAQP